MEHDLTTASVVIKRLETRLFEMSMLNAAGEEIGGGSMPSIDNLLLYLVDQGLVNTTGEIDKAKALKVGEEYILTPTIPAADTPVTH